MTTRRSFLVAGLSVIAASLLAPARETWAQSAPAPAYVLGATAITEVFGDGQHLVGVAIQYDRPVDATSVDPALYAVEGRTVTRVYAHEVPEPAAQGTGGAFVIVELSPDNKAARLYRLAPGGGTQRLPAAATISVRLAGAPPPRAPGENGPPAFGSEPLSLPTNRALNLVVDDFVQAEFQDSKTGDTLAYNLFVPKDRDPSVALPLVLFMHDAGATSIIVDTTLVQGLGAISWASPADQARHPAIVLAPQYRSQVVNDASEASSLLNTTLHLLDHIADEHNADRSRLYATGQSGGGMMSIAMMIREPELFAAAFLVACQWDPAVIEPLARQKLWVMVSEGDAKAFPGQNAIMDVIEREGAKVSRATWSGNTTLEQFATLAAEQETQGALVNYTMLRLGTVVPEGQDDNSGSNHINTWRIAYTIPSIRDWIMRQSRKH
jgi:predicted peptidase